MKLTPEIKKKIEYYINSMPPEELLDKLINKYGFKYSKNDIFHKRMDKIKKKFRLK